MSSSASPILKVNRIVERFKGIGRGDLTSLELSILEIASGEISTKEEKESAKKNSDVLIQYILNYRLGSGPENAKGGMGPDGH